MTIQVKVKTAAKEERVEKLFFENSYIVFTKEPALEGRANKSVISLLAQYFNVSKSSVVIKQGLTAKSKVVEILEED